MAAAPTKPHRRIASRLANLIESVLPDQIDEIEGWGSKPGADEFVPDVMVFDDTEESARLSVIPHLVVEILSTDRAAAMVRKHAKYAAAGLRRYWIIDPDGPEVGVHELVEGVFVERARHGPGTEAVRDVGPAQVAFDPGVLLG